MILQRHRSLRRARMGLIIVLSTFLLATSAAADWNRPPSATGRKSAPSRRAKRQQTAARAELEIYKLGPREFRALETTEMFTLAQKMYQFDAARTSAVYNEINRLQAERWEGNADIKPYVDLLSRRQQAYREILEESRRAGRKTVSAVELHRNREFSKILRNVRLFERRHRHRFTDAMDRIEPLLDPAKVEEAHRQWRQRAALAQSAIKVRGLSSGLSSKRFKKTASTAVAPKASAPTATKARPSQARPSNPAGRKPGATRASPRRRTPPKQKQARARPLGDWEKHVRDFIKRYELTSSQTHAALSILHEMQLRAGRIEKANRGAKARAEKIADARQRRERLSELNKLVDDLFHQLNRRLENLLTAVQRQKAPGK